MQRQWVGKSVAARITKYMESCVNRLKYSFLWEVNIPLATEETIILFHFHFPPIRMRSTGLLTSIK